MRILLSALALLFAPALVAQEVAPPQWIWLPETKANQQAFFTHRFTVPGDAGRTRLVTTADDSCTVFFNGKQVTRGRSWSELSGVDVTSATLLGKENVITVQAKNGEGEAGLLVALYGEGGKLLQSSSAEWKAADKPVVGWKEVAFQAPAKWQPVKVIAPIGGGPWKSVTQATFEELAIPPVPQATPVDRIKVADGFKVELLYSVPKETQGSWVAVCTDSKGRFIVSDQYGGLFRFPAPELGQPLDPATIEALDVEIGMAQGLLYAFDTLYVVVNGKGTEHPSGVYRLHDTDDDDQFDKIETIKSLGSTGGEHGPHAAVLGPDGESVYIVCGNQTELPEYQSTRVPPVWQEDQLLPRIYGRGFMKGTEAPRGFIAKMDPDGSNWEIISTGFRNQYDAAFNRDGELFTYDADMEWDMNTPWYRPTRVNHVISGAEFGWRNGSGKWPEYYPDSFGTVVDVGPGSPTGVCFGYGAKFPEKYQRALFVCDWSYGKMYAVHLEPKGGTYVARLEEFCSAQPLPFTDPVVHEDDGALYFAVGGRKVQSGFYRITYVGRESTETTYAADPRDAEARRLRRSIEATHLRPDHADPERLWSALGHFDRSISHAARIALEHQDPAKWKHFLAEAGDARTATLASVALARTGTAADRPAVLAALGALDYAKLPPSQRLDLLRAYGLAFIRLGEATDAERSAVRAQIEPSLPGKDASEQIELSLLLSYLQSDQLAAAAVPLLEKGSSQETQIAIAKNLRLLKAGWNDDLRNRYYSWFVRAGAFQGGASFEAFVKNIKDDSIATLTEAEKKTHAEIIATAPSKDLPQFALKPMQFQKAWTVKDLEGLLAVGLEGNRDYENGRAMFAAGTCFACHRYNKEGGSIGPDLTSVSGKFSPRDLLESIIEPSKEISDQYGASVFTLKDGTEVIGRIMNLSGDGYRVNTDMVDPDKTTNVNANLVAKIAPSEHSMMPAGLVNMMEDTDILDLLAYLLSGGDAEDPVFKN